MEETRGGWWLRLAGTTSNVTQVNLADCDDPACYGVGNCKAPLCLVDDDLGDFDFGTQRSVHLDVSLASGRSIQQLPATAALFIIARAPGGGPPLAVIRQPASAVPGQFTLSDANSMIQGRSLGDYDEVTLVARLSKSGQPIEQPGDWYAQARVRLHRDGVPGGQAGP